jgi:hypothetical protein
MSIFILVIQPNRVKQRFDWNKKLRYFYFYFNFTFKTSIIFLFFLVVYFIETNLTIKFLFFRSNPICSDLRIFPSFYMYFWCNEFRYNERLNKPPNLLVISRVPCKLRNILNQNYKLKLLSAKNYFSRNSITLILKDRDIIQL